MRVVYYSYLERPDCLLVKLTPSQERYFNEVLEVAVAFEGTLHAMEKLTKAVKLASRALVQQPLQRNQYESALVSYTAARAVSERDY